jgi:hypothetical protein
MTHQKGFAPLTLVLIFAVALGLGLLAYFLVKIDVPPVVPMSPAPAATVPSVVASATEASEFGGGSVPYADPIVDVNPAIAKDFDVKTVQNLEAMAKAYGVKFSADDLKTLADRKFVVKSLQDTSIQPSSNGDNIREFDQLYSQVVGPNDPKARGPENSVFFSSDVFFHTFNNLYTELLKEMENKTFYPAMTALSKSSYEAAEAKLEVASTDADRQTWTDVRNYFVVPYAILSTAAQPLTQADYQDANGAMRDPSQVMSDFDAKDAKVDTYDNVVAFINKLNLDAPSQTAVLTDLKTVYDAKDAGLPTIFGDAYEEYAKLVHVDFKVDFSQFTPRGTYTSSSLRRQYFRGMKWYIMLPLFLKSPRLTTDAFAITQLLAENPQSLQDYNKLEAAINFMVGTSDDLMPVDYLQALSAGKGTADPAKAAMDFLVKARNPKINDLGAFYPDVGTASTDETRLKTKGFRFFSGKFIIDSYWTGYLTQGDEAPRPGYTQKLPPMASALEVMTLLGSDYAKSQIPKLDFYKPSTSQAIDQALGDLAKQNATLTDADWQANIYFSWLWTIKSLFAWTQDNKANLPRFMQSVGWEAKTLQTATAWWTELRHATVLYAKQSFAELGGGGDSPCDPRKMPAPPKAYIEPQPIAYARLSYLAERLDDGLRAQGFQLNNLNQLENFVKLMNLVQPYVQKELADTVLQESVIVNEGPDPNDPTKICRQENLNGDSDWEILRLQVLAGLKDSVPTPTEGPILDAKDRRAALVTDVHTGQDSFNPLRILYEGTGVPAVIFTAVSDANGPRLTVGFISTQYEFTKLYGGQRMTDEDWQKNFYVGTDPYDAFKYTDAKTWPARNPWYETIFTGK